MKECIVKQVAREAKRNGLTLYWCFQYLREKLTRTPHKIQRARQRDTRAGDADAHTLRVESEALVLLLAAVLKAYQADIDLTSGI